jgi:hypothetical protein
VGAQLDGDAGTALGAALRLDPTLAAEPARLRRALADLAPHDERGWLLALGAALAVPELISQGQAAEAQARLADVCGCRPDAAAWALAAWALALGRDLPDGPSVPAGGTARGSVGAPEPAGPSADGTLVEEPGAPSALRVCVWPDGTPAAAVLTMRGVFVLTDVRVPARGRWRRVATVRSPLSRDVALAVDAHRAEVVWTDHDGLHARSLRRNTAGPLSLGGRRLLSTPPAGEQARYPLAALSSGADTLSVVWSADRRDMARSWLPAAETALFAAATTAGERLAGLDACAETERTAWLACRTDRGRILVARWDLTVADLGRWLPLDPPAVPVTAAIIGLDGVPVLVAGTAAGELLSLDVRAAAAGEAAWHSIDRPEPVRSAAPARIVAAAATVPQPGPAGTTGWLALAGTVGVHAMPVTRRGDIVECGDPIEVWTGA